MQRPALNTLLAELESLGKVWKIFCADKYTYRSKNHGTHDAAVTELLPRNSEQYFSILTLMMTSRTPMVNTDDDNIISKAGREYYYHAAKFQLRFRELLKVIEE